MATIEQPARRVRVMDDGPLQYLLLMGACLSLIGLALSGVMVSRAQAENDRRSKRLSTILAPHLRSAQIELSAFTVVDDSDPRNTAGILQSIFGFNLERPALYPAHWYVVLAITFALACGARYAADEFARHAVLAHAAVSSGSC